MLLPKPKPRDTETFTAPHDLEAEAAVLGLCFHQAKAVEYACEYLKPEMFFRRAHQDIFIALFQLREEKSAVDLVTITSTMRTSKKLESVGGPMYLIQLMDSRPLGKNVEHYGTILRDLYTRRQLVADAERTLNLIAAGEHGGQAVLADADARMAHLQSIHTASRMRSLAETATERFADLEWRMEHPGELRGVDTGFPSINNLTYGWRAGDLVIVAAKTSIGKTCLTINTTVHGAVAGSRGAVFSMEMRRSQLEGRILSQLSRVPLTRIQTGYLGALDHEPMQQALERMHNLPIVINDTAGLSARKIRNECRRLKADGGLGLIVVDYVQLMAPSIERKAARRDEEIADNALRLKDLAYEVGCSVLLLSQLKRKEGRPSIDDLKESGALEQYADIVILLHRKDHRASGPTECILAKQRDGETGTVILNIDRDTQTFTDGGALTEDPPAEERTPEQKRQRRGHFAHQARG